MSLHRSHALRLAFLASLFVVASSALAHAEAETDPLLEEPEPVDRAQVIRDLITLGFDSEDQHVRAWALRAAGATGEREWRDAISREIENAQPIVRINAALAMIDANHRARDAQALLTTELASGDAQTRAYVLDRVLPALPANTRAAILRDGISGMEDDMALRQTLTQLARRATGAEHAVLEEAANIADDTRRAWYVDPVRRAARSEGIGVAARLIAQRDANRQRDGLRILQAIGTSEAREAASPLLRSANADVAQEAGLYLARFGNTDALGNVRDLGLNPEMDDELRLEALAIVRDTAPQLFSFEQLQEALEQPGLNNALRMRIHEAIGATRSPEAIEYLRELLDADFADERMDGLSGIGYTGDTQWIETLRSTMASQGAVGIRVRAARGLGIIGGTEAAEILTMALRTERDPNVKEQIVRALGDTGAADAAQPIVYEFARNDDDVTAAGLDALQQIGNTEVAAQLLTISQNYRNPALRWKAAIVLTHLDPESGAERLTALLDRPPVGFESDLQNLPQELRTTLEARLLRHSNPEIAEAALARVRGMDDGGIALLRPLALDAPTAEVRRVAINTVTNARLAEDAPVFIELTRHRDRQVRLQAWAALAELRSTDHEELLAGQLNTTDVAVRVISAYGLIRMGRAS